MGYYTRARKLHECARVLTEQYGGKIPSDRTALLKLPGIGPYTASSICCFAFNLPETVVDGNVIRVIARLYGLTHAVTKEEIYALAQPMTPKNRGADYASAIMDLGATVCTPEKPNCPACPWHTKCVAYRHQITDQIPLIHKPIKQERSGHLWLAHNRQGAYAIRRRPGQGLLSDLYEFPWTYDTEKPLYPISSKPVKTVTHTFTHFKLTLIVHDIQTEERPWPEGQFVLPSDFKNYPFSTLMKKVIRLIR